MNIQMDRVPISEPGNPVRPASFFRLSKYLQLTPFTEFAALS